VEIPAGKFWMGWEDGLPGEGPRHPVMVDGFLIARTPVTNAEYARFVEATHVAPPPFWDNPRFSDPEPSRDIRSENFMADPLETASLY